MALTTQPGFTGYKYGRISSIQAKAIGKFTDRNFLSHALANDYPEDYDKKFITLYSQTSLYSNDFLNMINGADALYLKRGDTWRWQTRVPYRYPQIVAVPDSTYSQGRVGIDGKEFELVLDTEFQENSVLVIGHRMYGPQIYAIEDARPADSGFIQKFTLITDNPKVDFIDKQWLQAGKQVERIGGSIGEFDQKLLGLDSLGETVWMYDSLGDGFGMEHEITGWADQMQLLDDAGNPKDLYFFAQQRRNELPYTKNSIRWEPIVETEIRKQMLSYKVKQMIWNKPGSTKTRGGKQEVKKRSAGIIHRMRTNGNRFTYNRGEFSMNYLRGIFGDIFYRRVSMGQRKVRIYTNESGFDVFQQAAKQDALNSGLTLVANIDAFKTGNIGVNDSSQHLTYSWALDAAVTRETGRIDLIHLTELDLPQLADEFGQNKKSTPIFLVFDVSPTSDGTFSGNVREVRSKGQPSMTWGYIDGRWSHLGFAGSQGHNAANMFNGYKIFFDDRYDVFIEDLSRCVVIEENPIY